MEEEGYQRNVCKCDFSDEFLLEFMSLVIFDVPRGAEPARERDGLTVVERQGG
jgi:hypothetical protein